MGIIGSGLDFAVNHPVVTGGALVTGGIAARGMPQARSHYQQGVSQIHQMHEDAGTPMNFEAIKHAQFARYDNFGKYASARSKTSAAPVAGVGFGRFGLGSKVVSGLAEGVVKGVTERMIAGPLNKAWEIIDKKLYLEPRQKNVFKQAIQSDPMLARMMETNPELIAEAYKTVKTYAPSLTQDKSALQGFLRQIAITGIVDPASIRMLAETEKFIRASRGQIGANV